MANEIKLLSAEVTLTSASNFNSKTRIRITNSNAVATGTNNVITQKDKDGNTIGSITLLPTHTIELGKAMLDTFEATGAGCKAVAIFDNS